MSTTVHVNLDHLPQTKDRRKQTEFRQWMDHYLGQFSDMDDRQAHADTIRATMAKAEGIMKGWAA